MSDFRLSITGTHGPDAGLCRSLTAELSAFKDRLRTIGVKVSGCRAAVGSDAGPLGDLDGYYIEPAGRVGRGPGPKTETAGPGGGEIATPLDSLSFDELYKLAKEREVPGRSNMSKAELVEALG